MWKFTFPLMSLRAKNRKEEKKKIKWKLKVDLPSDVTQRRTDLAAQVRHLSHGHHHHRLKLSGLFILIVKDEAQDGDDEDDDGDDGDDGDGER